MLFCLKIICNLTNIVDIDEMQHYAAFHLDLHCLQKYSFRDFQNTKGKKKTQSKVKIMLFFVYLSV